MQAPDPSIRRVFVPPADAALNANIRRRYALEQADWIWEDDFDPQRSVHLEFALGFEVEGERRVRWHVSADQRYVLELDGAVISRGPHRSDPGHWAFSSYAVTLSPGRHRLLARVAWLAPGIAPAAQMTWRGGFIFAADDADEAQFNTGTAPWRVRRLDGVTTLSGKPGWYHVVGPGYDFDAARGFPPPRQGWRKPLVLRRSWPRRAPWHGNGVAQRGWVLEPTPLPDQIERRRSAGRVRAFSLDPAADRMDFRWTEPPISAPLPGAAPATVPAHTTATWILDLDDYVCGYPVLATRGGKGAEVRLEWTESFTEAVDDQGNPVAKGDRDAIAGRLFTGFGDVFRPDGRARTFSPSWWRAGRYLRLHVRTGDQALRLESLDLIETRYPYTPSARFDSADPALAAALPLLRRGLEVCAHETYMDCPYYEQLMYVGDTRVQALCWHVLSRDRRLNRRALELFDHSRWRNGLVAERYPSDPHQSSPTFAMIWVLMLRDYAWWQDDPDFVRERLIGARSQLESLLALRSDDGLLRDVPAWPFVDWVDGWPQGQPPGEPGAGSASINLHLLLALRAQVDLERHFGDPDLARRNRRLAAATEAAIRRIFWDERRRRLAEDAAHTAASEHAQALAVVSGAFSAGIRRHCAAALAPAENGLAPASIYFSHYVLEALRLAGLGDAFNQRLDLWRSLPATGFRTPPERVGLRERSDCHAWSSHPLFHLHASVAGIRPAAPGFAEVEVAPLAGIVPRFRCRQPHPRGEIRVELDLAAGCRGVVRLPKGVSGRLIWKGKRRPLAPGENRLP